MKKIIYYVPSLLILPSLVFAQTTDAPPENFGYIGNFLKEVMSFINDILVPLVFGVALLVFLYGMFIYFIKDGASEESRKKGQQLALWAIIGFVLMVSIWGMVAMIANGLFGGAAGDPPTLPGTPTF